MNSFRAVLVAAVVLLAAACSPSAPASPSASSPANKPTVVVQSPVSEAVLAVGSSVSVTGAASDTVGIDHVALFADGVSVASSPPGQVTTLVPFSLTWLATPAGPHVLQVIAYRSDGTASDPFVINVVVGAGSSVAPLPSSSSAASLPPPITPAPTKKPRPSKMPTPRPTPAPTTSATDTATPTPTPTTPPPTADLSGNAPDDIDSEPYEIALTPDTTQCPQIDTNVPVTAVGCIWEQVSAPAGDTSDDLEFTQAADTTYRIVMTSCSDASGTTVWSIDGQATMYGCGDGHNETSSGGNPGSLPLTVGFFGVVDQTYNLYQLTVYQCQFAICANQ